jgi:hypothetical protein
MPGAYLCSLQDPNGNGVEFSYGHPVPPARIPARRDASAR